jgi:hypothetical protein
MIADTSGGADARLLVRAAAILVIATTTAMLVGEMLVSGGRSAGHLVDERTGETWACAPGGCQVND